MSAVNRQGDPYPDGGQAPESTGNAYGAPIHPGVGWHSVRPDWPGYADRDR